MTYKVSSGTLNLCSIGVCKVSKEMCWYPDYLSQQAGLTSARLGSARLGSAESKAVEIADRDDDQRDRTIRVHFTFTKVDIM